MLSDNTFHTEGQAAAPFLSTLRDETPLRLNEIDRRSVDLLLSGDDSQSDGLDAATMERVNRVRHLLGVLEALPSDEPQVDLAEVILRKVAALQAPATQP